MTMTLLRRTAITTAVAASYVAWNAGATTAASTQPGIDATGLSQSVKPCTDFYAYANESWLTKTKIPDDRSRWGTFSEIEQRNDAILKAALRDAVGDKSLTAGSAGRKVADYYASGMDTAAIERAGLKPLHDELARIDAIKSREDLIDQLAHMHRTGSDAGFAFGVNQDAKDSTRYLAQLYQAGIGLPDRDFYFKDDSKSKLWRAEYVKHVARMLTLMGDKPAQARREADTVMRMETRLAGASMTKVEQRDPNAIYNKMKLADLTAAAPGADWARYFQSVGIKDVQEFNIGQPKFFKELAAATSDTPLADWKTYLRWHLARATASKLPSRFEKEGFRFYQTVLKGTKTQLPREKRVIQDIMGRYGEQPMGQAMGELYVAKAFPPEAKARALELVTNVKAALRERITQLDWMSADTKAQAQKKLDAIMVKIGYPDNPRDYSTLKIDRTSYVQNSLRADEFEMQRNLNKLGKPVDRAEWGMSPPIVNAYYNPQLNEIVFPAGILQPPFFDPKADDAVNYGAIGMIIGHEITHGFDDEGRQFDADGNLKEWWKPEDAERYNARATVVEKQYDQYAGVDGLKLNGKLTLGENIADLGGLKIAYLALQKALANKKVGLIDGMTPDQRFFISYAQAWRDLTRPEQERVFITTNPHSPARFRVKGPLANLPEFAKAFSCQATDSALRAENERVNIW